MSKLDYLGCWITDKLDPDQEINTCIESARTTFNRINSLLCDAALNLKLRQHIFMLRSWNAPFMFRIIRTSVCS